MGVSRSLKMSGPASGDGIQNHLLAGVGFGEGHGVLM